MLLLDCHSRHPAGSLHTIDWLKNLHVLTPIFFFYFMRAVWVVLPLSLEAFWCPGQIALRAVTDANEPAGFPLTIWLWQGNSAQSQSVSQSFKSKHFKLPSALFGPTTSSSIPHPHYSVTTIFGCKCVSEGIIIIDNIHLLFRMLIIFMTLESVALPKRVLLHDKLWMETQPHYINMPW